jgi:hypothetical protein
MNRQPLHHDDSWDRDPVWKLLEQAPPAKASPRFADDVLRAARLAGQPAPWWRRIMAPEPAPALGLAAAAAAVFVLAASLFQNPHETGAGTASKEPSEFAEIQELAESEILLTAVDHLDDLSDVELVSLIGF